MSISAIVMIESDKDRRRPREAKRFGFLLIDDFALMSFASAISLFAPPIPSPAARSTNG